MSANGNLAVNPSGILLVHGTDMTPAMVLADYDSSNAIWDDSRNLNLELVAEFHDRLMARCQWYLKFYHQLTGVQHDQFITALALALGTDPQSYSAPNDLVEAGVKWCIDQGFSYENHGGFLETRDWLRSGGAGVFLDLSERFGEVLERNSPNPRVISAPQGSRGDVPPEAVRRSFKQAGDRHGDAWD